VIYLGMLALNWLLEMVVSCSAILLTLVIPYFIVAYYLKRKPANLRMIITLVFLKVSSVVIYLVLAADK
jgi:hypothetical protein